MEINGSRALLTGATGGLGRAIASELADAGAKLILSSRKADELEALAATLPGAGHRTIVADLAVEGTVDDLIAEAGDYEILLANAGVPGGSAIERNQAKAITRVILLNLEVPMLMAAAARGPMLERGSGQMVFISSLAGKAIPAGSALYAATKAGLRAFALGLRADLHDTGVGVSTINPGFVREAGMFHESGASLPPGFGTAAPEDVGRAVRDAIAGDRGEIDVAPIQQRALVNFAYHFHSLSKRLERAAGVPRLSEQIGAGRDSPEDAE